MEKLNRAQKCSILRPQNLGSRGGLGPQGPPLDSCLNSATYLFSSSSFPPVIVVINNCQPLVYTFIPSFIPTMILLNGFKYRYHID